MLQKILALKIILLLGFLLLLIACSSLNPQSTLTNAAQDNVKLGLAYLKIGQSELAKSKLLLALQENSKSSIAYDAMGYFLEQTGEAKKAEQYYLRAISLAKPKEKGGAFNNYGAYLYRQKHFSQAIRYFIKATQEPTYLNIAAAYMNASHAAEKNSQPRLAKFYLQKSRAADSKQLFPKK